MFPILLYLEDPCGRTAETVDLSTCRLQALLRRFTRAKMTICATILAQGKTVPDKWNTATELESLLITAGDPGSKHRGLVTEQAARKDI